MIKADVLVCHPHSAVAGCRERYGPSSHPSLSDHRPPDERYYSKCSVVPLVRSTRSVSFTARYSTLLSFPSHLAPLVISTRCQRGWNSGWPNQKGCMLTLQKRARPGTQSGGARVRKPNHPGNGQEPFFEGLGGEGGGGRDLRRLWN